MTAEQPALRTEAGRRHETWVKRAMGASRESAELIRTAILAIEREAAAAPALDVDRLARVMGGLDGANWPKRWEPEDFEWLARQIATEYAAAPPSKKVTP